MKVYFSTYEIAKGYAKSNGLVLAITCEIYNTPKGWVVSF